jgi:hypothetical protein
MRRSHAPAALGVALVMAGCSSHAHRKAAPSAAAPLAWRAAMNDWFDNARFDRPHSCAAVTEAARELPAAVRSSSLPAFRRYEARVCH